ncbi:MAG: hypothetical protein NC209_06265 [Alistipes sp.]|nr:hypothetical protein [Alistipes senegalensis]MCM1250727.1 hypothetical protein [Alistipes sp.]
MKRLSLFAAVAMLICPLLFAQETVHIVPAPQRVAVPETQETVRRVPNETGKSPKLNPHEVAILDRETNEWVVKSDSFRREPRTLAHLYMEGGCFCMTLITLCLVAMLFAAWKAPNWVEELGKLARLIGFFYLMIGIYSVSDLVQSSGIGVSFTLFCGGLRVGMIAPMYGALVYGVSLLLRIALKPRI